MARSPLKGKKIRNLPEEPQHKFDPLTAAQVRALLGAVCAYWRPAVLLAVSCGLRRGELFGLRIEDVDLKDRVAHVRQQMSPDGQLCDVKTDNAERDIPLPSSLVPVLEEHLSVVPPTDNNLLFPTENGYPVHPSNWRRRVWKPAVEKAGLREDLHLHDLRKQFASVMVGKRRSMAYFQSVMGHGSAKTTLTYYTGLLDDEARRGAQDMDDWLAREDRDAA